MVIAPRSRTLTDRLAFLAHLAVQAASVPVLVDGGVATKYFKPSLALSGIEFGMVRAQGLGRRVL